VLPGSADPEPASISSPSGAEVGIPGEVLQERIGAEEGLQKEDLKGAGNSGQYLAAGAPEEPSREEMPDLFQTAAHEEPSGSADLLGKPEKSVGRTAACQRNSSREKFYRCVVCGKNFLLKINLIIHQKSHSNWLPYRPYCCPACGKGFIQKHHLQKHQRIHGRLYRCIECTESFPMQTLLEEHQRRHTQQRPFQCNGCSKSFRHRQSLNHHQKVHAVANAPAASLPNRGPGTDPCKWDRRGSVSAGREVQQPAVEGCSGQLASQCHRDEDGAG
uniref:C2H2-type domain-containing protein n=1 Tax=Phasianus colchicus TaxID=9054 RepID=A0A669QC48_PHACC